MQAFGLWIGGCLLIVGVTGKQEVASIVCSSTASDHVRVTLRIVRTFSFHFSLFSPQAAAMHAKKVTLVAIFFAEDVTENPFRMFPRIRDSLSLCAESVLVFHTDFNLHQSRARRGSILSPSLLLGAREARTARPFRMR